MREPTFECGSCYAWSASGDFVPTGEAKYGRTPLSFVCERCQRAHGRKAARQHEIDTSARARKEQLAKLGQE